MSATASGPTQLDHLDADASGSRTQQWAVRTPEGVLLADHLVLTRCAHSQLRRMLSELGMTAGQNLMAAMHALGMYLVGVGQLITPTPKEVLRQAKAVGQAISAKVHPDGASGAPARRLRPRRAGLPACSRPEPPGAGPSSARPPGHRPG